MLINHTLRLFHCQQVGICAFIVTKLLAAIEADRPAKAQSPGRMASKVGYLAAFKPVAPYLQSYMCSYRMS